MLASLNENDIYSFLIFILIYPIFSFAIAYFLGKQRQIGFKWSMFFCLTLFPITGLIITMLSRKYSYKSKTKGTTKRILGQLIVFFGIIFLLWFDIKFGNHNLKIGTLLPLSGLIGLGLYLIDIADVSDDDSDKFNLNL